MSTLAWIVCTSIIMSAVSLIGSVTLFLPQLTFQKLILPLVGLAAGTLVGSAFFHLLPESINTIGNHSITYLALAFGFICFFVLEQFLHWHHCHGVLLTHHPVSYLILCADGLHNLIGGLAVGTAFMIDTKLGIITALIEILHEIPQELGDFGILIHSGWKKRTALIFNLVSSLTFPLGALFVYGFSYAIDTSLLLPFAAGNFLYIGAVDLVPQLKSSHTRAQITHFAFFVAGISAMFLLKATT